LKDNAFDQVIFIFHFHYFQPTTTNMSNNQVNYHIELEWLSDSTRVALRDNTIEKLTYEKLDDDTDSVVALADALSANTSVTSIDIDCRIDSDDVLALANALKVNTSITKFDLGFDNKFGDAGAVAFADALKVNTTVTEMCLMANHIYEDGVSAIAEALKVNATLTSIFL
jgi:hypothetical protein